MISDQRHECVLLLEQNVTGQRYFSVHLYNKPLTAKIPGAVMC